MTSLQAKGAKLLGFESLVSDSKELRNGWAVRFVRKRIPYVNQSVQKMSTLSMVNNHKPNLEACLYEFSLSLRSTS
jgi:hypothetical protein